MSVDYYLACHDCQTKIHVAQDGMSGWSWYSGEPDCMEKLSAFMEHHKMGNPASHHLQLIPEQQYEYFHEIEWKSKQWLKPDIGGNNFKKGDRIRHLTTGGIFTGSLNNRQGAPLIECVDEGGSGFSLWPNEVEPESPASDSEGKHS